MLILARHCGFVLEILSCARSAPLQAWRVQSGSRGLFRELLMPQDPKIAQT
jgi:hypothetical protein